MNPLNSLLLPMFFGLITGIGHGVISHHHDLPFSLTDQIWENIHSSMPLDE